MKKSIIRLFLIFSVCWYGCNSENSSPNTKIVEVKSGKDGFQLYRYGNPYFIKGAGGSEYLDKLACAGGNSIRIWNNQGNVETILDEAHKNDITVTMVLEVKNLRHGFDYGDAEQVDKQYYRLKQEVLKYKNHPALLVWSIGNELDLISSDFRMWREVNRIAKMIHEIDPHHPTTTSFSNVGKKNTLILNILCPEIDILSINKFGDLPDIPERVKKSFWNGPYIITEWGPTGFWESERTAWDVAIEENSTIKAELYKTRYESSIKADKGKCLGSYVFMWGQKQERTPTWFSLFDECGAETATVGIMEYLWSGKSPANKAPEIDSFNINGLTAYQDIFLQLNSENAAEVWCFEPDNETIHYEWSIKTEITGKQLGTGGDKEKKPVEIPGLILSDSGNQIRFKAPAWEGPYRLYVSAYDKHNKVATANIPFYVIR